MRPAQDSIDISRDLVTLLPRLRRFALTLTRNVAEADALVDVVCERATNRPSSTGHGRLEDVLYSLARTLHEERHAGRKYGSDGGPSLDATSKSGVSDPVQRLILSMPQGLASVFLLVAVEKRAYRDAARILGIGPKDVADRLVVARRHFAALSSGSSERRA